MAFFVLSLGLAALAAAAPTARQVPNYPPTSLSQGFRFIANVTDPSRDFSPSINGWAFQAYHIGAGLNQAVLHAIDSENPGNVFYENGTASELYYGETTFIFDGGEPLAPFSLSVQGQLVEDPNQPGEHDVFVDVGGAGTPAKIASFPNVYPVLQNDLGSGTFIACNTTIPYYQQKFITIGYAYSTFTNANGSGYDFNDNVPEGCAPITLVSQCATLEDLPAGSISSHEYANTDRCYEDVSSIVWSQYGP